MQNACIAHCASLEAGSAQYASNIGIDLRLSERSNGCQLGCKWLIYDAVAIAVASWSFLSVLCLGTYTVTSCFTLKRPVAHADKHARQITIRPSRLITDYQQLRKRCHAHISGIRTGTCYRPSIPINIDLEYSINGTCIINSAFKLGKSISFLTDRILSTACQCLLYP